MVKVLTAEQIREADHYTIEHEPIASVDLMERAASKIFEYLIENFPAVESYSIFCGVGNNGGDGLVLARLLVEKGIKTEVFILEFSKSYSPDFQTNLDRLSHKPLFLNEKDHAFQLPPDSVVIDAIFGTGPSRAVEGFTAKVIDQLNEHPNYTIAIDLPSGIFAEENPDLAKRSVIKADLSLTFQFPKLCCLQAECAPYIGAWDLIDIGLHQDFIEKAETPYYYFTHSDAAVILKKRNAFTHKGEQGRAFMLLGSKGKMGAAVLSSMACLRSGVGLLTVQIPKIGYTILQSTVPEAMVVCDKEEDLLSELITDVTFNAIGIGPGIGKGEETQNLLKLLIQQSSTPMVIDADALNILAENRTWLSFLPKGSILTPHPLEFKRLTEDWNTDLEKIEIQRDFSRRFGVYVVLKGRHTSISTPDGRIYFNSTGNPGMATAGSGDVLTGILTSFLAQGYAPEQAALLGVYLHGLAGDFAAEERSVEAMIAGDIVEYLGEGFKAIQV